MLLQPQTAAMIDEIFKKAQDDGRTVLFEHEVYSMLSCAGLATPQFVVVHNEKEVNEELIAQFHGKMVVKVVSRDLAHKQKYGGVKVVETNEPLYVRYVISAMEEEILSHFEEGAKPRIDGFMLVDFVPFKQGLGYEILFGAREDIFFGPVVTLTKGGDDAEFFAKYYDPANLYLSPLTKEEASASMASIRIRHKYAQIGKLFYMDRIAETLKIISDLAQTYSFVSPGKTKYHITALDINPMVFTADDRFIVVDGYGEFAAAHEGETVKKADPSGLSAFFKPGGVAVVGVSSQPEKYSLGRNIAQLMLEIGRDNVYFVNAKGGTTHIMGREYPLYRSIAEIPANVDLYVYTAPAKYMLDFLGQVEENKSVILISGIPSEIKYSEFLSMLGAAKKSGVRIVGPNCMGVFYAPDKKGEGVNTLFIDSERMPIQWGEKSNTVLFSQSGAMAITCLDNLHHYGLFRSIVSFGNGADVGIPELMAYFEQEKNVDILAMYMEGLVRGEGRRFFDLAKASEKPVIVFKSGRTEAGSKAAASHTAAMSGSYEVFKAACSQAGVVLIEEIDEFYDAIRAFSLLWNKKVRGNRVAGVVNAGFESTAGADNLAYLQSAEFTQATVERLYSLNTHGLVNVPAPFLDVTPMTDDALFEKFLVAMMEDENVDCVFTAVIPHIETLMTTDDVCDRPEAIAMRIINIFKKYDKPMVVSVNAGQQFDKFVRIMEEAGVPVFKDIRSATRELERFVKYRMEKGTRN
ncbi:MAG: acetate--CoA ligase family protein [Christensenellales bacterium]